MPYNTLKKFKLSDRVLITNNFEQNKNIVMSMPACGGVYLLTTDRELERLKGASDILYIGRSGNLRKRAKQLFKYLLPEDFADWKGKHTASVAVEKILKETSIKIFISYVTCGNYKELETELLQKYCKNHIETSPLNNQRK
jgi:hypothetical protein